LSCSIYPHIIIWFADIQDACRTLLERIEPYKKANPNDTWREWVNGALTDRVNLSATGFYKFVNNTLPVD